MGQALEDTLFKPHERQIELLTYCAKLSDVYREAVIRRTPLMSSSHSFYADDKRLEITKLVLPLADEQNRINMLMVCFIPEQSSGNLRLLKSGPKNMVGIALSGPTLPL